MEILRQSDFSTTLWEGGSTTQLYIYPGNADVSKRDFEFRISTANVTKEESIFSNFENYQRILIPISGKDIALSFENENKELTGSNVNAFDEIHFDGAWLTKSKGQFNDFNCIFSSNWKVDVEQIYFATEDKIKQIQNLDWMILFAVDGSFLINNQVLERNEICVMNLKNEIIDLEIKDVVGHIICLNIEKNGSQLKR